MNRKFLKNELSRSISVLFLASGLVLASCTSDQAGNGSSSGNGSSGASSGSSGASSGSSGTSSGSSGASSGSSGASSGSSGASSGSSGASSGSSGSSSGSGTTGCDATSGDFPNCNGTGSTPVVTPYIYNNGTQVTATNFTCTQSLAAVYGNAVVSNPNGTASATQLTTATGAGGALGGGLLTGLLGNLGGTSVTDLLNSVGNAPSSADNSFNTYSTFTVTAAINQLVSTLTETVMLPTGSTVSAGTTSAPTYAVFALDFPPQTAGVQLASSVQVTTYLSGAQQEQATLSQNGLSLLGTGSDNYVWLGVQTTKPYDSVAVSLIPTGVSANVGTALKIYEACSGGTLQ